MPEAPGPAVGIRRALALALLVAAPGLAIAGDGLPPLGVARYVNHELGFMLDVPAGMTACERPREMWREGIVLPLGRGVGCATADRAVAFVTVTGEPNTEAFGDVESFAASVCADPTGGGMRIADATRAIDTLPTLACMVQADTGSVAIEVMAQNMRQGPPVTWTNLRVTLIAPGDRWSEFTRVLEEIIGRVRRLP